MKQGIFEIVENIPLTENVFKMTLRGDISAVTAPGQFVNIKIDGFYLRRPIRHWALFRLDLCWGPV